MLVDSHCHLNMLDLSAHGGDLAALLQLAAQAEVGHILCVGVDLINSDTVIGIAEKFSGVSASVGIHPSEKISNEPTVEQLVERASHPKVIAMGETGLDYHYNDTGLDIMRERFRTHIRAAITLNKPLIIHSRNAQQDTLTILREENARRVRGVMHCFTEGWEMAEAALNLDFYISFSGIITFKNAQDLVEVVKKVPLERILIETDAPYLTPVPFRGKANKPQYVRFVAEKIAEIKNLSYAEVTNATTQNFANLFNVDLKNTIDKGEKRNEEII